MIDNVKACCISYRKEGMSHGKRVPRQTKPACTTYSASIEERGSAGNGRSNLGPEPRQKPSIYHQEEVVRLRTELSYCLRWQWRYRDQRVGRTTRLCETVGNTKFSKPAEPRFCSNEVPRKRFKCHIGQCPNRCARAVPGIFNHRILRIFSGESDTFSRASASEPCASDRKQSRPCTSTAHAKKRKQPSTRRQNRTPKSFDHAEKKGASK